MTADRAVNQLRHRLALKLSAAGLCVCSLQALASTSFDTDCPTDVLTGLNAVTVAGPSLQIESADRNRSKSAPETADTGAPVPTADPAITSSSVLDEFLGDEESAGAGLHGREDERPALPKTATRLPGIAEEDLPRFRRQMFRTDI